MMNPVSVTWELWITSYANVELWCKYHGWRRSFLAALGRILASAIVILVATVFPGFDRVMVCNHSYRKTIINSPFFL